MDDAARRAEEIVRKAQVEMQWGLYTNQIPPLERHIATALRELEAERDGWRDNWQKACHERNAVMDESDALATRLAQAESERDETQAVLDRTRTTASDRLARVEADAIRTLAAVLWSVGGHVVVRDSTLVSLQEDDTVETWRDATGATHYTVRVALCRCGHDYAQHSKGPSDAPYCRHCPCPALTPDATTEGT